MRWTLWLFCLFSVVSARPAVAQEETDQKPAAGDSTPSEDDLYAPVKNLDASPDAAAPDLISDPILADDGTLALALGFGDLDLKFGGGLFSTVHYRLERRHAGGFYNRQTLQDGFSRQENTLKVELQASVGRFAASADIDLDWLAHFKTVETLADLALHQRVDPVRLEAHSLYIEALDVGLEGLDLRLGQQIIAWGVGDQFNPTNTINPTDLDDILLFGKQIGNFMVRADYGFLDAWSLSLVVVPVFKPAVTPATGTLALTNPNRLPFVDDGLRQRLHSEKVLAAELGLPTVVDEVKVELPANDASNIQAALRLAGTLADQDLALSYYIGRTDFPQAIRNHVRQDNTRICDPDNPARCTLGRLATEVTLGYPRLQVIGLNATGEIPLRWLSNRIAGIGYRFEMGLYLPKARRITLTQDALDIEIVQEPAGEYDYDGDRSPGGERPLVVDDRPFLKWVLGFDYSFGSHVYLNMMWVHGLVDEYGAGDFLQPGWAVRDGTALGSVKDDLEPCYQARNGDRCAAETLRRRLGDYLVLGVDLKFLEGAGTLRLFTIWDLGGIWVEEPDLQQKGRVRTYYPFASAEGFSAVLYPELSYNLGNGLQVAAGALFQLGRETTKFGDIAAGGHLLWARVQFRY